MNMTLTKVVVKINKLVFRTIYTNTASMIPNLTEAVKVVMKSTNVTNTTTHTIILHIKKLMTVILDINTRKKKTLTPTMTIATTIIITNTMTRTCMVCSCTF